MERLHSERLRSLYAMMRGIPARRVNLGYWRAKKDKKTSDGLKGIREDSKQFAHACGTVACLLGWATAYPKFKRAGLKYDRYVPKFKNNESKYAGAEFFGLTYFEACDLFGGYNYGPLTDKRQALWRIRQVLLDKGIITAERNRQLAKQERSVP